MSDEVVAPAQPEVPATPPPVDAAALQAEIQRLQGQVTEKEHAAQYWHSQAKGTPAAQPKTDEPEEDMLEVIGRRGVKGVDEVFAKRGYVKKEDVQAMVQGGIQAAITEINLNTRYPDLKDKQSEFFKATAKEYNSLTARGVTPAVAAEVAAEMAELAELRAGKRKIETDTERNARIKAQSPEGTRRTTARADDEGSDELDADQKAIIEKFGITEDGYKKRAKAGVQMGVRK